MGTRKIQSFAGTLASTNAATTAYADGDCLVELGTLNVDAPDDLVTPSKIFIHRALIGITTAAGQTLAGNLALSSTSGTATNAAVCAIAFGSDKTATNGTFTIQFPTADATNAIIRLA